MKGRAKQGKVPAEDFHVVEPKRERKKYRSFVSVSKKKKMNDRVRGRGLEND